MKPELRIGVVDSGHSAAQRVQVVAGRRFSLVEDGLAESDLRDDPLGHGSAVIEAIGRRAPSALFCVAQVFDQRGVTSALQIATAIDWLVAQDVRLINLSLGLRQDRSLLRDACAAAVARGVLLCASSPAQGEGVFPANYPQVLRVTGDARCAELRMVVARQCPGGFRRLRARHLSGAIGREPRLRGVERAYRRVPGRASRGQQ